MGTSNRLAPPFFSLEENPPAGKKKRIGEEAAAANFSYSQI
jgi:hypothetical protein